jgi:hypothetical protein
MDILSGIALLIGVLVALNMLAGGKATDVLRPFMDLVLGLMSILVNLFVHGLRIGISACGRSLKTVNKSRDHRINDHAATPPRW